MDESAIKKEVWKTVQAMNRLWTVEGKVDELVNYFHKKMVAVTPTDRLRLEGGAACVAGWKGFTDAAKIHYWEETDPRIDVFGNGAFAVVTYYYDMSFDMGDLKIRTGGRDMMSLVNEGGKWLVVADQFSPDPI
jgi:hypothetical protein